MERIQVHLYKDYEYSPLVYDEDDHYHVTHFVRNLKTNDVKKVNFSHYLKMSKIDFQNFIDSEFFENEQPSRVTSHLLRITKRK